MRRGYKELTMADLSRSYANPLHMLGPCRHHRLAVAARVQLSATLSADGTAPRCLWNCSRGHRRRSVRRPANAASLKGDAGASHR